MATDSPPSSLSTPGRTLPRPGDVPPGAWAALAVSAALLASYADPIRKLFEIWGSQPSYSHGYLVVPIALLIQWQRRDRLASLAIRPSVLGWLGLLGVLGARYFLYEWNEALLEQLTIPVAAAFLILAFGGPALLWWAAPGLAFSVLMLPLPANLNAKLAGPLQTVATVASAWLLTLTGLPVLSEGHIIFVGSEQLEVARACNGLSMLLSFVTLIAAVVLLAKDRPTWERVVLLLSTIPIALASNVLRIVITAWFYYLLGPKAVVNYGFGKTTVGDLGHDAAGWGMMPIALGLVWLELKILSWLIVPEEVRDRAVVILPGVSRPVAQPAKGKPTANPPAAEDASTRGLDGPGDPA